MLISLHIKDFAIIDELEAEFKPGLNVMTGETGAGKTIIAQALNLILGDRAQSDCVRTGREKAQVTAIFDAQKIAADLKSCLDTANIEWSDELIINRTITTDGRGKIAVNGVPVTVSWLKSLGQSLVDVSSQHEHQLLLVQAHHASIVDSYGGLEKEALLYTDAHAKFLAAQRELSELEANEKAAKEKLDFLKFQFEELSAANLKPDEEKEIEAERLRLKNAGVLEEKARTAETALYGGDGSAMELIDASIAVVTQCEQFDSEAARWREALSRARAEVEDVARDLANYAGKLESNPERLEEMDERFHLVRQLVKKHGGSIDACLKKKDEIKKELDTIVRYDDIVAEKKSAAEKFADERRKTALLLSDARKTAAKKLGKAVEAELKGLGMGKTALAVVITKRPENEWDESGPDHVEFVISPNAGEPLRPLARIASGGELSRVMLAVKCVLSGREELAATSVFDEVDSGIGGAVAEAVGKKLKEAAKSRQVICITHLPQVAVYGDHHIRISKRVLDGRTVATLEEIRDDERTKEIARMMGGAKITNATVAHAKEMLNLVKRES